MANPFDLIGYKRTLKEADSNTIQQFKEILPDFLLEEWESRGFSSYQNGLLMTTNPNDYYDIIGDWVDGEAHDCHVVFRSAFGSMLYLKEKRYYQLGVEDPVPPMDMTDSLDLYIEISLTKKTSLAEVWGNKEFLAAQKKFGCLEYDEVFGFFPAIPLGGSWDVNTIKKVKLKEHLAFLAQL